MNQPFKQPRSNKPKDIVNPDCRRGIKLLSEREIVEMARHGEVLRWSSDSEQDTQLQTTRHRKDNSAWGKRMEKELGTIERRAAKNKSKAEEPTDEHSEGLPHAESGADSDDDMPIVKTLTKGQPKFVLLSIGTEVMRQFDSYGTVRNYDKKEDLYKLEYSDGDVEDFDKEEFIYAYDLAIHHADHASETPREDEQLSSDEETEYVLPKVLVLPHRSALSHFRHITFYSSAQIVKKRATTTKKRKRSSSSSTSKEKSALTVCISAPPHHQAHH
jgi:hypothetical protein